MVTLNLFPAGILQFLDVVYSGYRHTRGPLFLRQHSVHLVEWLRLPADLVFIGFGVKPLVVAALLAYKAMWRPVRTQE